MFGHIQLENLPQLKVQEYKPLQQTDIFLKNITFYIFLVKMADKMFFLFKVRGAGVTFEIYCWSRSRIISGRLRFPGGEFNTI